MNQPVGIWDIYAQYISIWLVVYLPLWKMMEYYYSQYMETYKNVLNHQPDKYIYH